MPNAGLMPGANQGGTNVAVPGSATSMTPAIGGASNPFNPIYPAGASAPSVGSPYAMFPANGVTDSSVNSAAAMAMPGMNTFNIMNGGTAPTGVNGSPISQNDFVKAMYKAGYSAGDAGLLWNFIAGGAGFNPQVAQSMIAAMQPQVNSGEADLLENFSSQGMRFGSPAAIGMSDFLSQVNLNEGQIWANMYEQAVSNYMNVLLSGKRNMQPTGSTFQNLMQYVSTMSGAVSAVKPNRV